MEEQGTEAGSPLASKRGIALVALVVVIAAAAFMLFRGIGGNEEAAAPSVDVTRSPVPIPLGDPTTPGATGTPSSPADASAAPSAPAGEGSAPTQTPVSMGFGPQVPDRGDWRAGAEAFAAAYANPAVGRDAWLAALKPHVTESTYLGLESTDISRVSQDEVKYVLLDDELDRIARYRIYFVGGSQTIAATSEIQDSGGWLVNSIIPAED